MPMEELPAAYEEFFSQGKLPEALQAEHDAAESSRTAAEAERLAQQRAAEAKAAEAGQRTEAEPPRTPAEVVAEPVRVEDSEGYRALQAQIAALQAKIEEAGKPKVEEPVEPDPVDNPLEHLKFHINKLGKQLEALQTGQQQTQQLTEQEKLINHIVGQVKDFTDKNEDYPKAFEYLKQSRLEDYKLLGYNDKEANQLVQREHAEITQRAVQTSKNPAQLVYDMAKKYGYRKDAVAEEPASKIARIKEGMKAEQVTERATHDKGKLTVSNLREASNAELDDIVDKRWDELFGGTKKSVLG